MSRYRKRRYSSGSYGRRSGGNIVNIVVGVLVAFLLIGFLGSLFREAPIDPDLDATKTPVTDETEPEKALLSFTFGGDTFYYEEGMTWDEFIDSDYCQYRFYFEGEYIRFQGVDGDGDTWYIVNDGPDDVVVLPTDAIDPDDVATW